jgi:hypothetical protein
VRVNVFVFVVAAATLFAQKRPDFSGIWQLNRQQSQVDPSVKTAWIKIQQSESAFVVNMRVTARGQEENQTMRFVLGPEESINTMHEAPMKSHASWDGNSLVVNSVVTFGTKPLRLNDRWDLADDRTLTFTEHHQFNTEPEGESKFVMERRNADAWPAEQPPKLAEEVFKNIQIFKRIPAPTLLAAMTSFSQSLGVECGHCHVPKEFEKDDKSAKQTARQMFRMAAKINADNFNGVNPITCWTCHRGSTKPQSSPQQ